MQMQGEKGVVGTGNSTRKRGLIRIAALSNGISNGCLALKGSRVHFICFFCTKIRKTPNQQTFGALQSENVLLTLLELVIVGLGTM